VVDVFGLADCEVNEVGDITDEGVMGGGRTEERTLKERVVSKH
jgi:hypothetical protein